MAVDEQRLERMEQALSRLATTVDQAMRSGSAADQRSVEVQQRRIEDEFSEDELRMVRDHRAYSQHRRMMDMYLEEIESDAQEFAAADDGEDGEDGEDAGKKKAAAKKKTPPAAKKKAPGRHEPAKGEDGEDAAGEGGTPDELPGAPAGEQQRRRLGWLASD